MTTKEIKELWGEDLYKVFADAINEEGWLSSDWSEIIEKQIRELDEDYNVNSHYKETYQRMYNLNHIESDCGKFIKPVL